MLSLLLEKKTVICVFFSVYVFKLKVNFSTNILDNKTICKPQVVRYKFDK